MPTNKREHLLYTVMMVSFMAFTMGLYNFILLYGFTLNAVKKTWLGFPLTFITAFICEWFVVRRYAGKVIARYFKAEDSIVKKIFLIPLVFVPAMAGLMSFYGALLGHGFVPDIHIIWAQNFIKNMIIAYPLVILGTPLISFTFRKIFPIGGVVEKS